VSRRKGPKVEAWVVVTPRGDVCGVSSEAVARELVRNHGEGRVVRLVPADPDREAVVRAAVKNAAHLGTGAAALEIRAAVEKLQRKGRKP
jgi:hypothetical protein